MEQRLNCILKPPLYAINGNGMRTLTECWVSTSKNSAKLKQYYYFHADFLEEIWYTVIRFKYMYVTVFIVTCLPPTPRSAPCIIFTDNTLCTLSKMLPWSLMILFISLLSHPLTVKTSGISLSVHRQVNLMCQIGRNCRQEYYYHHSILPVLV